MNQNIDQWCKQHHITKYKVVGNVLEIDGNIVFFQNEYETCPLQMKVRGYVSLHIGSTDNYDLSKFFAYIDGTLSLTAEKSFIWADSVVDGGSLKSYIIPAGCKRVVCGLGSKAMINISLEKSDTQLIQGPAVIERLTNELINAPQCRIEFPPYVKKISVQNVGDIRALLTQTQRDVGFMNLVLRLPRVKYKVCKVSMAVGSNFNMELYELARRISDMLAPENIHDLDPFEFQELLINTGFTDAAKLL